MSDKCLFMGKLLRALGTAVLSDAVVSKGDVTLHGIILGEFLWAEGTIVSQSVDEWDLVGLEVEFEGCVVGVPLVAIRAAKLVVFLDVGLEVGPFRKRLCTGAHVAAVPFRVVVYARDMLLQHRLIGEGHVAANMRAG